MNAAIEELEPVFLTARWERLVMVNFAIDPAVLRGLVPRGTELDTHEGVHAVSLVAFQFLDTRVRGIPIPGHRDFDEVNLRFYVRRKGPEGWRRGVVFVREIVPRRAIAWLARWLYNENYVALPMASTVGDVDPDVPQRIRYRWKPEDWVALSARHEGAPELPAPGSAEEFITEHYWGYSTQRDGSTVEYRVEHPSWQVWPALDLEFEGDWASFYGEAFAPALGAPPLSAFIARGSEVQVRRGKRIGDLDPV